MKTIGIGVAGAGTVGGTLVARLVADCAAVTARTGLDLEVRLVAVSDLAAEAVLPVVAEVASAIRVEGDES